MYYYLFAGYHEEKTIKYKWLPGYELPPVIELQQCSQPNSGDNKKALS
jgi:hypothetical protein